MLALFYRILCLLVATWIVAAESTALHAQGFGAVQAVRQRVSGLGSAPEGPPGPPPVPPPGSPGYPEGPAGQPGTAAAKLDTTYVPATAAAVIVVRPAQIIGSPFAQVLPVEIATNAVRQNLGMELADLDEVIAFGDMSNPLAPNYGIVFKFNKPFRAVNIPQPIRAAAKRSEFNGKKYLQSSIPTLPSFYGPDNKTLIMATDDLLRKIVPAAGQPKSGGLIDRIRDMPGGNDLFAAVDVARLKGLIQMKAAMSPVPITPESKQLIDAVSALDIKINLVRRGPISIVLHCNDEATAQQLAATIEAKKPEWAPAIFGPPPSGADPTSQALSQWRERMIQRYQPQQSGADINLVHIEADDPLQPQLFGIVLGASLGAKAALAAYPMAPGMTPPSGPNPSAAPGGPEADARAGRARITGSRPRRDRQSGIAAPRPTIVTHHDRISPFFQTLFGNRTWHIGFSAPALVND